MGMQHLGMGAMHTTLFSFAPVIENRPRQILGLVGFERPTDVVPSQFGTVVTQYGTSVRIETHIVVVIGKQR